jgi:hypothetical protein
MKKYFISFVAMATVLASCTSDVEEATEIKNDNQKPEYILSLKPLEFEDETRVNLQATSSGITFTWSFNEVFGVFPMDPSNGQVRWNLTASDCSDEDHYAKFSGQGWQLEKNVQYAAYHPFSGKITTETPYTNVPVTLPQNQAGSLEDIGRYYDFTWAVGTYTGDVAGAEPKKNVVFDFSHAIAIVEIVLPANAEKAAGITVDFGNSSTYITNGSLNAGTGKVIGNGYQRSIGLSSTTTNQDGREICYLPIFPTTLGTVTIHYYGSDYSYLSVSHNFNGKKLQAGKAYRWSSWQ